METILYSDIIRRPVEISHKNVKCKLVEVVAYRGEKHWRANEVMIESGFVDREGAFYPVSALKDMEQKGTIQLRPKEPGRVNPKTTDPSMLSGLMKKMVVDSSGEELGRVYDFELYVGKSPWIVWKMLINPTGLKPTKRRLRIPTDNISKVTANRVLLK